MADWNEPGRTQTGFGTTPNAQYDIAGRAAVDQGLRRHMLSIYNYMTSGVLLSGIVALLTANSGLAVTMFEQPALRLIVMLSPLAIVFAMSFGANRFSKTALQSMFWVFAVLMGLSLSTIFLIYTGLSIAATFFATAGAFAGLSLVGYTTRKDLSAFGTFLTMGLIGLILVSLINWWLQSQTIYYAVGAIGIFIFAGFTAYDTQRLKQQYYMVAGHGELAAKAVVLGALSLYLDFINLFLLLLRFMGGSRN